MILLKKKNFQSINIQNMNLMLNVIEQILKMIKFRENLVRIQKKTQFQKSLKYQLIKLSLR